MDSDKDNKVIRQYKARARGCIYCVANCDVMGWYFLRLLVGCCCRETKQPANTSQASEGNVWMTHHKRSELLFLTPAFRYKSVSFGQCKADIAVKI